MLCHSAPETLVLVVKTLTGDVPRVLLDDLWMRPRSLYRGRCGWWLRLSQALGAPHRNRQPWPIEAGCMMEGEGRGVR